MGIKLKHAYARLQKAKGEVNVLVSDTVYFRRTFKEHLEKQIEFMRRWKKKLPVWAYNQLVGYTDVVLSTTNYHGMIYRETVSAHLYKGRLYWEYGDWRKEFPDADGSELSDTCCTVWKQSVPMVGYDTVRLYRVFNKHIAVEKSSEHPPGFKEDEEAVGKWFPACREWKGER